MAWLRPEIASDWWVTGRAPVLGDLVGGEGSPDRSGPLECVDHHIFSDTAGLWHLWGCIRGTAVGRILYHWTAARLIDSPWIETGNVIRASREAGESLGESDGAEWIQSPYVVRENKRFFMFFGGHGSGLDDSGKPVPPEPGDPRLSSQISLMWSDDGLIWDRHRNLDGTSRLFIGPGEARDPCVLKIGNLWHLYYAGHEGGARSRTGFYARTSSDLIHWSEAVLVHRDVRYGSGWFECECPHVVEREGRFYLFRTRHYGSAETFVFASDDPTDFGRGDARRHFVCCLPCAAPEIITGPDGQDFLSSSHLLAGGNALCRLRWVPDRNP